MSTTRTSDRLAEMLLQGRIGIDAAVQILRLEPDIDTATPIIRGALPDSLTPDRKDEIARTVAIEAAISASSALRGVSERTENELRRERVDTANAHMRQGISIGAECLLKSGKAIERFRSGAFTRELERIAAAHGVTCETGSIGVALIRVIASLRDANIQAIEPPPLICKNTARADSEFDKAVSKAIGDALPLRAQSRLLVSLRAALGIMKVSQEAIYQRIRDARR